MHPETALQPSPEIRCRVSDGFAQWLSQTDGSVVFTTYQANLVARVGWHGQQVNVFFRRFDKPMGLAAQDDQMALVTRQGVVLLANSRHQAPEYPPDAPAGFDALYLPRASYTTCDLLIHDVAFGAEDQLWIVATRFSCLARLSHKYAFEPLWHPPFVGDLTPDDRCHLNGLAMDQGKPRSVTALGATDTPRGWQSNRVSGGVLIDVPSGEIILDGLCMPHSPRWHDGMLWFSDSGRGNLCVIQPGHTQATVVCHLPGYLRGLSFVGMHALVGLSLIREKHTFGGMPIGEDNTKLCCGVALVDLRTGEMSGLLEFPTGCEEIYEVQYLPGTRHGMILNTEDPACHQAITTPDFSYWMRPRRDVEDG